MIQFEERAGGGNNYDDDEKTLNTLRALICNDRWIVWERPSGAAAFQHVQSSLYHAPFRHRSGSTETIPTIKQPPVKTEPRPTSYDSCRSISFPEPRAVNVPGPISNLIVSVGVIRNMAIYSAIDTSSDNGNSCIDILACYLRPLQAPNNDEE
ncbi:hypothetical protein GWI33_017069 [Rhynchophorus ferrugineus]|uniref:Uncharacterized protein n=1 Tax=Rhynchophorus ferrugineus TaxID=354439 RepID=A0A834M4B8_RHYFE|nr:hypothetical protein GWI33_017069 [Rhynchophorus ferrugineus]